MNQAAPFEIERLEPSMDAAVPPTAVLETLSEGHEWLEGPLWVDEGDYLLFSDIPANTIFRFRAGEGCRSWLRPSGYTGDTPRGGEMGSNALTLDLRRRLVLCQHGDRRMARLETPLSAPEPRFVTLADRYAGKRLNSPNDAIYSRRGSLYFTDPPYGLAAGAADPARELESCGLFRLDPEGKLELSTEELGRPNGVALSPDESILYVSNSEPERPIWMAYDLGPDGRLGAGRLLFDAGPLIGQHPGLPDGMAVARDGTLFATGPGGLLVLTPEGELLGRLLTPQAIANCAFGPGERSLYLTAHSRLLRLRFEAAPEPGVIVVMGVAGAGKTTVGRRLAARLAYHFVDADDLHPEANRRKMAAGRALDEEDRTEWLEDVAAAIVAGRAAGRPLVVACSALRAAHRARLRAAVDREPCFVHLRVTRAVLADRLERRADHFFAPSLLDSQLETLEAPARAIGVDADESVEGVLAAIEAALGEPR